MSILQLVRQSHYVAKLMTQCYFDVVVGSKDRILKQH